MVEATRVWAASTGPTLGIVGYLEVLGDWQDSVELLSASLSVVDATSAAEYGLVDTMYGGGAALLSVPLTYRGRGPEMAVFPNMTSSKISCRPSMLLFVAVVMILILVLPKTSSVSSQNDMKERE